MCSLSILKQILRTPVVCLNSLVEVVLVIAVVASLAIVVIVVAFVAMLAINAKCVMNPTASNEEVIRDEEETEVANDAESCTVGEKG